MNTVEAQIFHVAIHYADGSYDDYTGTFADSIDALITAQEVMEERPGKVEVTALNDCHAAQRLAQSVIAKARAA